MDFKIINSLLKQGNWDPEDEVINSKSLSKLPRDPVVLIEFKIISTFVLFLKYLYETIKKFVTGIVFKIHSI